MAQKVTIKTLAQDLGISHMTVSRALSNHAGVSQKTRDKVLQRANALGYVRSAAATAMRGDGTRIVGLLLPNFVNEFYARFANHLAVSCEDHSLNLIIHLTDDDWDKECRSLMRLREVQADAVVMVPAPRPRGAKNPHLDNLHVTQLIRTRKEKVPVTSLEVDDSASIMDAVDHLAARGHKKIAYIGATRKLSSGKQRFAAFQKGLARNNLSVEERLVRTDVPTFEMGQQAVQSILDTESDVSALVCGGFEVSNGALETCLRNGLSLPDDLAFVGYGDTPLYKWLNGGITTIDLPTRQLAETATAMIERMRQGKEVTDDDGRAATQLLIRQST